MRFIRTVWQLLGSRRRMFTIIACTLACYEAVKATVPYLTRAFVDTHVASNGQAIGQLHLIIAATFITLLIISKVDLVIERIGNYFLFANDEAVWIDGVTQALRLPMPYHEREQAGVTTSRIDRGVDKLNQLLHDVSWQTIPTICSVVFAVIAMAWVDPHIALIFSVSVPPILWLSYRQQQRIQPWRAERHDCYDQSWAVFCESIWNMRVIQSFAQEPRVLERFATTRRKITELGRKQVREDTIYGLAKTCVGTLAGQTCIFAVTTWKAYVGQLTIGDIVFFTTFATLAYKSVYNGLHLFGRVADAYEGIERFAKFLAEQPSITDAPDAEDPTLEGAVAFEDVAFTYPNADRHAIRGMSFAIAPGETVAFTGPSGAGKSTITQLLLRNHDVADGRVLLDARDLRTRTRSAFRAQIGYVPQEGQVFSGTIAENIRFGKPDATDDEVRAAATLAGADTFIAQLKNGYATMVGEQGVTLSGGQRQRIAIARAVVRKPKILIFDEATASLDVEHERIVQESLERLKGTATILVIAHRLSTIQRADRILVVENGRIVEEGTHRQLLHLRGLYYRLVALQDTAISDAPSRRALAFV